MSRRRRRPPTLLTLAARSVRDHALFRRGDLVLCACSGGPDSSALLHVLALLRRRLGHRLRAVGVDHGLRPAAAEELAIAAVTARELEVPFEVRRVRVSRGGNLQMRAREHRLRALQTAAARHGAAVVATGHTADDRAETVLLRLLRGAGPRGLAAMPARASTPVPPRRGRGVDLVRPLLRARRWDVMAHLARHGVRYASDPSNADRRFLRVRVRHELLPLLEELSPGVVRHLCALADMLEPEPSGRGEGASSGGVVPVPVVSFDGGTSVQGPPGELLAEGLGRAQREALARAVGQRRGGARIRIAGGRDLELRFFGASPVLFLRK